MPYVIICIIKIKLYIIILLLFMVTQVDTFKNRILENFAQPKKSETAPLQVYAEDERSLIKKLLPRNSIIYIMECIFIFKRIQVFATCD